MSQNSNDSGSSTEVNLDDGVRTIVKPRTTRAEVLQNLKKRMQEANQQNEDNKGVMIPAQRLPYFNGSTIQFIKWFPLFEHLVDKAPSLSHYQKYNILMKSLTKKALTGFSKTAPFSYLLYEQFKHLLMHYYYMGDKYPERAKEEIEEFQQIQSGQHLAIIKYYAVLRQYVDHLKIHKILSTEDIGFVHKRINITLTGSIYKEALAYVCSTLSLEEDYDDPDFRMETFLSWMKGKAMEADETLLWDASKPIPRNTEEYKQGLKLSSQLVYDQARDYNWCFNCLQPGHTAANCQEVNCSICQERHHKLMHGYKPRREQFH